MILNFLGRGSAFNVKEGNNSAYIRRNDELLLLDCGESIFERIVDKNLLNGIKQIHVLITHMDSDHVGSLSSLIYYCYCIKHIVANVYFPFPNSELCDLLKIQGHTEGQDYKFKHLDIDTNKFDAFGSVKPVKVQHTKTLNCYGYLIYIETKLIWYSGDCSNVSEVINKYKIDEFYQDTCLADFEENVHTSLRVLCKTIPKDKRNNIYCMHIDCNELIQKAKDEGFNIVEIENKRLKPGLTRLQQ